MFGFVAVFAGGLMYPDQPSALCSFYTKSFKQKDGLALPHLCR